MGTPTHHRSAPVVVRKAKADTHALSVTAVLTFPGIDQAGDIVHADGLDFTSHANNPGGRNNPPGPWVDLEHNGQCVGWARKSLSAAGGQYGLERLRIEHDGQLHLLPVGTTWFDPGDRLQSQVFSLVAEDALPGVSLEFKPLPRQYKAIGRSPIERRASYEFFAGDVVRWTHCASPVNEGATVAKSLISPAATDKLLSVLSSRRVGSEPIHPTIYKALSQLVPKRRLVRVEKSMEPNADLETAYDEATPDAEDTAAAGGNPTAQAANNIAQGLKDLAAQARGEIAKGEHKKGRKQLNDLVEELGCCAADALKIGAMVDADLSDDAGESEPDGDEGETDLAEDATDTDDEGVMKGIPVVYRKALKRFTLKQITKAREAGSEDAGESESQRELRKFGRALRRSGI